MSKKKNSKHPKNNSKQNNEFQNKLFNNKTYQDDFLGKTIELAPNAYDIYSQKHDSSNQNTIVIRSDNQAVIDPNQDKVVTDEKIVVAEAKIEDVLSSLSTDGKQQVVDDIFKSINQEKAEFDNKIKQSSTKINPDTLFDKIYTKEFIKPQRSGFFGFLADVFGSQLVWSSVALALIVGVILFYFQGLQPAVLANYSTKVKNQGNDLAISYTSQVEKFFTTSANVVSAYTYEQGVLCSQIKTYDNVAADSEQVSSLQFSIFANQKLKTVENYSYFFNTEIKNEYQQLYSSYSSKLDKYIEPTKNLRDYIRFLEFRNNLIKSCGEVELASQNLDQLKIACSGILVQFSQFKEDGLPVFWSSVQKPIEAIETSCSSLAAANVLDFVKSFFVQFDEILFYRPNIEELNQELTVVNQDLINQDLPNFKKRVNSIVKDKSSFPGIFYLLGIEI